jgi:uncharacterized protein (DUF2237 family)
MGGPFAWHLALRCGRGTDEFSALAVGVTNDLSLRRPAPWARDRTCRLKWKRWYRRDTVLVQRPV